MTSRDIKNIVTERDKCQAELSAQMKLPKAQRDQKKITTLKLKIGTHKRWLKESGVRSH